MPIPKNWVEELAIEWLTIEGYMTESNVRLKARQKGGVPEADVLGAKLVKNRLQIRHIERGALAGGFEANLKHVVAKFDSADRKTVVEAILRDKLDWQGDVDYESIYIASYAARVYELKVNLRRQGIEFHMLESFIKDWILKAIDQWKNKQIQLGLRKTQSINSTTLPESHRLLCLLDFLRQKDIITDYIR